MAVKEYNWENFEEKDVFQLRLKGDTPNFGYISHKSRRPFLTFLVKNGFLEDKGKIDTRPHHAVDRRYKVMFDFVYSEMADYRPGEVHRKAGKVIYSKKNGQLMRAQ